MRDPFFTTRRRALSYICCGTPIVLGVSASGLTLLRQAISQIDQDPLKNRLGPDVVLYPAHLATQFVREVSAADLANLPVLHAQFFRGPDWPDRLRALIDRDFSFGLVKVVGGWLVSEHEIAFGFAVRDGRVTDVA